MKLQAKVILILASIWAAIFVLAYIDSRVIVAKSYRQLENKLLSLEIRDTIRAFDRMQYTLSLYSIAWSQWDDAYKFMQHKSTDFINANFVPSTFISSGIDFFIFYDTSGKYYFGQMYDAKTDKVKNVPASVITYLDQHKNFTQHSKLDSRKTGILSTADGFIVMSSEPVITGKGTGPIAGTLLMGYYLNVKSFANLSELVGMPLSFYRLPIAKSNKQVYRAYQKLLEGDRCIGLGNERCSISMVNRNTAYGFIFLNDIDNKSIGLLRTEIPRTVVAEGKSTTSHYLLIMLGLGFFIILLTWYLLKIFVLDRIINIGKQVQKISKDGKFDKNIKLSGTDELSAMVSSINHMMALIAESQRKLRYLADHDMLTKLPNRTYFFDLITKALVEANQQKTSLAVMFLDMDKFKEINDKYGHVMGDKILSQLGKRLADFIDAEHIVARQSGDEFILFVKNGKEDRETIRFIEEILQATSKPYQVGGIEIESSFSIGISIYPSDGISADELLKKADKAMYAAKRQDGNAYQFYSGIDLKVI